MKLGELTEEIANALIGESKFTPEILSNAIDKCNEKITEYSQNIIEKEKKLNNQEGMLNSLDYYYDRFLSWANEFKDSTLEKKKMICCEIFKAIYVGKNTEIRLVMDSTYEQFLAKSTVA